VTTANTRTARLPRLWRRRGGLVTLATVASLVAGLGLTVLGLGAADQAVASFDAASWAWSRKQGEVARINGVTARVDTRVDVPQGRGHQLQVSQTDRFVILRDLDTGQVSSMDLTTLQIAATSQTTAGLGVSVALHDDAAFVVDAVQGVVSQLDPRTLTPVGEPIRFLPGITGGVFDGAGRLWIAAPGEGTVTAITPAELPSEDSSAGTGAASTPRRVRTVPVAPPSHDLDLSSLDTGVAVLNRTTNALTTIRGEDPKTVSLQLAGPGTLPSRTSGPVVPVTVPDDRHVYVVGADGVHDFEVPGKGTRLRPAVAWKGFIYCADEQTGTVHVFDAQGRPARNIAVKSAGGPLELEVRENHLFINAPDSSTARVVDDRHAVRTVDKYVDEVLGGDPPPAAPPAPKADETTPKRDTQGPVAKPKPTPTIKAKPKEREKPRPKRKPKSTPKPSAPGPPLNVRAEAGNAEARVTWRPAEGNHSVILRYEVTVVGTTRTFPVGAEQRSLQVPGLVNGESYSFAVHAVNGKGAGPEKVSNEIRPTAEVPDAPTGVTAEARPDGSVAVRWEAANGQGLAIRRYAVSAVRDGASTPVGESEGTELVVPAGNDLEYGRQYAFTVVAVNERGAGSSPSKPSDTVIPFTKPGAPVGVDAATIGGSKGSIRVVWGPATANGSPVTQYRVVANGQPAVVTTATKITLDGFADGKTVTVKVTAVNEAGEGPAGQAVARTVAKPRVTITSAPVTINTATVNFRVDQGGGTARCAVSGGGKVAMRACTSARITGLKPGTKYTFTVTASNAAGSGTASRVVTTSAVYGIARCVNGAKGDTKTYCNSDRPGRNGNEIFKSTSQQSAQAGWAKPGTRLKAYCKKSGEEVYAYIYNKHKRSRVWIRVDYKGKNYIPWAWLNLTGKDDPGVLPNC
jgi:hypothetical protein